MKKLQPSSAKTYGESICLECCVLVLYGSETWTLQKEDIRRLEAFEMWIRRRMMKYRGLSTKQMKKY